MNTLLRTASRRAVSNGSFRLPVPSQSARCAIPALSILSERSFATAGLSTFKGTGFKTVGLRSWTLSAATSSMDTRGYMGIRKMSTFLSSYDEHVAERAKLAGGIGVAPQPLNASQVTSLIDEIKAAAPGSADSDRVSSFFLFFPPKIHLFVSMKNEMTETRLDSVLFVFVSLQLPSCSLLFTLMQFLWC